MFGWIGGRKNKVDSMEKRAMDELKGAFNRLEESEERYASFKRACAAADSLAKGMSDLASVRLPDPPDLPYELDPVEAPGD